MLRWEQRAELVAAHPIRTRRRPDGGLKSRSESCQERVPGGVTEGVVVALEAVQVEQNEHLGNPFELRQILEQPATVSEARECVGQRFAPAAPNHQEVVAEDKNEAEYQGPDTGCAENQRQEMDPAPVVVDEDAKSCQAEDGGRRQELPALDSGAQADLGSPRGKGEQTQSEQPTHVEKRPGHVCVCRNPEEVERVCDGEAGEPGGDQHPLAAGPPAGHREHSDDERKQHHVAERVCEVRRDGKAVPTRGLDDRSERNRRSNRSDAESADCTVEPGRMAHAGKSGTGEKKNSSIGREIEEEPKRIGDRGIRHRIPEPENGRVVGVPQRPKKRRSTDAEPWQSICAAKGPDEDEPGSN